MTKLVILLFLIFCLLAAQGLTQSQDSRLHLEQSGSLEVVLKGDSYITYVVDDVIFTTNSATIYCDSAIWIRGQDVNLKGHVRIVDSTYQMSADSVFYDITTEHAEAWGKHVELWSYKDSIYATGVHALYQPASKYFAMDQRPLLYLRYPDTTRMVEVLADSIEYNSDSSLALAGGDVHINSNELTTTSGFARMELESKNLLLTESPVAYRANSEVSGNVISVNYHDELLESIIVTDSAEGRFMEPISSDSVFFDESILRGDNIEFRFQNGRLDYVLCYGQAYSWYYPSPRGGTEYNENAVSGDSIRFISVDDELSAVRVTGGAVGTYVSGRITDQDTIPHSLDSVDYQGLFLEYSLNDSTIVLKRAAGITTGTMSLTAYDIYFDTRRRVIEAFSADVMPLEDSVFAEFNDDQSLQPSSIPVLLKDGDENLVGDYLEYSIDTKKGRIIKSKTNFDAGYYYGERLFREQEKVLYIDNGRYTTCDLDEPHFHFHSSHLKLIENDKLIARPVVFYIGRIPVMILPYYVFPLKKGRHSGILPIDFGDFHQGARFVRNVGYYWAASEYWDWQGSFDYIENDHTFTFNSRLSFAKIYKITNTFLSGSYTNVTRYDTDQATEWGNKRWVVNGAYNHQISPSFKITASGKFISDKDYYTDYSPNLDERLTREIISSAQISKKFSNGISLTTKFSHTVNLDTETRTDNIPSLTLSLPIVYPFGNGRKTADGKTEQSWYHNFKITYSPTLQNYSYRYTPDSTYIRQEHRDSIWVDSLGIYQPADTVVDVTDTLSYRSRKEYAKIQHSPKIFLPSISFGNYLNLVPSIGYSETWFKIFETDQSLAAGIEAGNYRTHSWHASVSASTKLYGTVSPNILGITGLRHVLSPSASYSYTPDINEHPEVRSYAGGGAGSNKSSKIGFSLGQLFQTRVGTEENAQSIDLISFRSGFSYDFEKEEKPFSNLTTSYTSSAIPNVSINGSIVHDFYEPETDNLSFFSPYMQSFSFNTTVNLKGAFPFFDELENVPRGADSIAQLGGATTGKTPSRKGSWSCRLEYRYSESGRDITWKKTNSFFAQVNINFNLTRSTSISYSQRYDFLKSKTINNSVNIIRRIHCWTGSLYWVPTGSNRGFGFKLCVTELPEIKIDNGHDSALKGLQRFR